MSMANIFISFEVYFDASYLGSTIVHCLLSDGQQKNMSKRSQVTSYSLLIGIQRPISLVLYCVSDSCFCEKSNCAWIFLLPWYNYYSISGALSSKANIVIKCTFLAKLISVSPRPPLSLGTLSLNLVLDRDHFHAALFFLHSRCSIIYLIWDEKSWRKPQNVLGQLSHFLKDPKGSVILP